MLASIQPGALHSIPHNSMFAFAPSLALAPASSFVAPISQRGHSALTNLNTPSRSKLQNNFVPNHRGRGHASGVRIRTVMSAGIELATKMLTCMTLLAFGDFMTQVQALKDDEDGNTAREMFGKFDWHRMARQGTYGAIISAPICHVWFPVLENIVPLTGEGTQSLFCVAQRVLLDQIATGPINLSSYLAWMSFWEDFNARNALYKIKQDLPVLFPKSMKVWIPVHMITFSVIPDQYRVLWIGIVSIMWGAVLSSVASGSADEAPPPENSRSRF